MRVFGLILALVVTGSIAAVADARGPGPELPEPATRRAPRDEGVLGIHGPRRLLLHDHVIERSRDQGRLEGGLVQGAGATSLESDVVLVVGPGNYALGHVTLDLATGAGEITFAGRKPRVHAVPCHSRRVAAGRSATWPGTGSSASVLTAEPKSVSTPGRLARCASHPGGRALVFIRPRRARERISLRPEPGQRGGAWGWLVVMARPFWSVKTGVAPARWR